MIKRDYYEVLEVEKTSDSLSIKRSYRSLAMIYHPDKNPDNAEAVERMKEINEAYAVLSDDKKRALYDTYGHAGLERYSADDIFRGVDFGSLFREFGLGDIGFGGSIFDTLFGTGRAKSGGKRRGADLRYDLEITLEEAAFGVEKKIEVSGTRTCSSCGGTGSERGEIEDCEQCKGSGQIVKEQKLGNSVFRQIAACSKCRGKGRIVKEPCKKCHGKGSVREVKGFSISVPQGADTGYNLRIEGEGRAGNSGAMPGDLYVVINVKDHDVFERHGDDIYMAKEITFAQAALGGEIDNIPSLNGSLKLEIQESTQNGTIFRLKGKGIPHLGGYDSGDLYVMVKVVTPEKLTEQEKELLREFAKLERKKGRK